jgi:RNA polymerase sigma factor (sigma-70 family)
MMNTQDQTNDRIGTRKSLLGRLKDWEDNASWREFFDTYWKLIYASAIKSGLTHQEAEEVVQETVLAVAKSISSLEYNPERCRFKTWLLTVTRSKIANLCERKARHSSLHPLDDDSRASPLLEKVADVKQQENWERLWESEWEKNLMDAAIQRVKRKVSIEQFQMFDLFVIKGWPARDVAKTLHVTMAHVYVAKHRITKLVQKEIEQIEQKEYK